MSDNEGKVTLGNCLTQQEKNKNLTEAFFLSLDNEYPVTLCSKINDQVQQYAHITGIILKHKKAPFTDKYRFSNLFVQERNQKPSYVSVQTQFENE